jgi:hypothetical protein
MDSDMKWYAIMMIGMFMAMALMSFSSEGEGTKSEREYKACIKYHTPKECKDVR